MHRRFVSITEPANAVPCHHFMHSNVRLPPSLSLPRAPNRKKRARSPTEGTATRGPLDRAGGWVCVFFFPWDGMGWILGEGFIGVWRDFGLDRWVGFGGMAFGGHGVEHTITNYSSNLFSVCTSMNCMYLCTPRNRSPNIPFLFFSLPSFQNASFLSSSFSHFLTVTCMY